MICDDFVCVCICGRYALYCLTARGRQAGGRRITQRDEICSDPRRSKRITEIRAEISCSKFVYVKCMCTFFLFCVQNQMSILYNVKGRILQEGGVSEDKDVLLQDR